MIALSANLFPGPIQDNVLTFNSLSGLESGYLGDHLFLCNPACPLWLYIFTSAITYRGCVKKWNLFSRGPNLMELPPSLQTGPFSEAF